MRIIEWNINQRANHINTEEIPPYVAMSLLDEDPDFFILTEFYKVKRWEDFEKSLPHYELFFTENSCQHQNDVCIGIKKDYPNPQMVSMMDSTRENHHPNFLHVSVDVDGISLNIIGTRIRIPTRKDVPASSEENQNYRLDQLKMLESYLDHVPDPIIVLGDFNNYRRGHSPATLEMLHSNSKSKCTLFNMTVIQEHLEKIGFTMHTPDGYSWGKNNPNIKYQFAQDHAFTKGLKLVKSAVDAEEGEYHGHYTDEFMKFAPDIYENNCIHNIHTPYPDHKMLVVDFDL